MKAVRIHGWSQPPSIEEIDPPARSAGRSLVRMQAATVGHIDRTVWGGRFLRHPPLPYVPGVEAAGIVIESDRFQAGQRVWLRGAGLGTLTDGTWRECIAAPDEALGLLPDNVPMPLGAAFFSPCTSAWVALHEIAKLQAGERVLVTGATGAVGSLVLQLALELGAKASAVVSDAAAAAALPAGVDAVVFDGAADALSGLGVDALIDTVGGPVLAAALPAVVAGGRAVLIGYTAGNELRLELANFMLRDVSLLPLNMFRRDAVGRAMAPALLARLGDGRLRLEVRSFALSEAASALEWIAQRGHRGRAVLVPDPAVA
ncbi:quinone oxidoreductase family protein [Variovorax sp. PBL-E5]|uniref:quinone oxidoreductase family protein n=1 Tax=Variovorax sp. PBL-E5 TaxID=434014 RepID=UPI00131789D8|nr:zinc-binding alcohol dehydrogenase family protein [Variovorax sp. PBL-E5]VTU26884.1 Alcohol dehydrogenase [Variovorax sp. PBL-E5]